MKTTKAIIQNGINVVTTKRADDLETGDRIFPYVGKEFKWCCYPYTVKKTTKFRKNWTVKVLFESCSGEGEPVEWTDIFQTNDIFIVKIK